MTSKAPPVPPANRSPKGPGDTTTAGPGTGAHADTSPNPDRKGRGANIAQNTTHQGHQQDR